MCFITNGDLFQNQRTIYKKIEKIEIRQVKIISMLNNILNLLTQQQEDKGE